MNKFKLQKFQTDQSPYLASLWLVIIVMSFVLIGSTTSQAQTKPEPLPEMPAKIFDKVAPVTVKIASKGDTKVGTGAIVGITTKGHALILTACHVVATNFEETDPNVELEFHEDLQVKIVSEVKPSGAKVLTDFIDKANDLALLVTVEPVAVDNAICYTHTDKVNPGEKVAALSYPRGDKLTQTVGRIIRLGSKHLVFDAKIAPGSSGGPLVDKYGRMIGVSTLVEGGNDGYAIHMNLVLSVVDGWLQRIKLKKKWKYEKYPTGFERTVKSWPFLAGSGIVVFSGGLWIAGVFTSAETKQRENEGALTTPPTRP